MGYAQIDTWERRDGLVLGPGEFFRKVRFGKATVNRGAVLLECEWDGGTFESGIMLAGIFLSGVVRDGTFSGVIFRDGCWQGGTWLGGFDRSGRYRPRTDHPSNGHVDGSTGE